MVFGELDGDEAGHGRFAGEAEEGPGEFHREAYCVGGAEGDAASEGRKVEAREEFVEPGPEGDGVVLGEEVGFAAGMGAGREGVEGENFPRMILPLKRLSLTKMKIEIQRGARTGTFLKAAKKAELAKKWAATPIAKKLAKRATRANLSDLERFQCMISRKKRSLAIKKKVKVISKKK